jgi:UDP-N-acetylmuramoylalanine--D-glutamate ligase
MAPMHGYQGEPVPLGDVLVLGLGTSGKAAASYLSRLVGSRVDSLTVLAGKRTEDAERFADELKRACGAHVAFDTEEVEGTYHLCIASPGISEFSNFYRNALRASKEVVSEVEFAWRESPASSRWVAITGTNGKTTTTALTAHVLSSAGLAAVACGNIGDACIDAVAAGDADVFVAEVSSYQLASTSRFCPDVAVLLNITPDHIKWHRSLENYAAAKYKVLANLAQAPDGVCILDAVNDVVREGQVKRLRAQSRDERGFDYVPIGCAAGLSASMRDACGSENAAFLDEGVLRVDFRGCEHRLLTASSLQIKGEHNASNALAAASVGFALGLAESSVRDALASFTPLAHRIEPCGSVRGVACYNDSKATNVDATLKALSAFGEVRPIVLLGGDDKGTDLAELVSAARAHCKAVVCYGASAERFLAAFGGVCQHADSARGELAVFEAEHMEDALDVALGVACEGDVVALSPACASFDEFSCYQERGDVFKRLVAERSRKGA